MSTHCKTPQFSMIPQKNLKVLFCLMLILVQYAFLYFGSGFSNKLWQVILPGLKKPLTWSVTGSLKDKSAKSV